MLSPNVLRAIALLAPGKRVTVFSAGESYELPELPALAPVVPPDQIEIVSQKLLERDAETRATVAAVKAALDTVAAGQAELTRGLTNGVKEIVGTLHLPVVPTKYDKDGRIVEARRKEKP